MLLLVAGRLTRTNASLLEACRRLGVDAEHVCPGRRLSRAGEADALLGRLDVRTTLDGVEKGLSDLRRAARHGVDVLNEPGSLLAAHDKLATALRLSSFGVPHPRTAHVGGDGDLPSLEPPFVVKPRFGSWGKDVVLCPSRTALELTLRRLRRRSWFRRQGALVQEVAPLLGYDLRLVVAGGEVVGAIERHAAPGEWRTNVSVGGRRRPVEPPPEAKAAALSAAAAVGADLVGVDLLPVPDGGWLVLELNGAADFTAEYSLGGSNVFDAAVRALGLSEFSASLRRLRTCASSSSTMNPLFGTP